MRRPPLHCLSRCSTVRDGAEGPRGRVTMPLAQTRCVHDGLSRESGRQGRARAFARLDRHPGSRGVILDEDGCGPRSPADEARRRRARLTEGTSTARPRAPGARAAADRADTGQVASSTHRRRPGENPGSAAGTLREIQPRAVLRGDGNEVRAIARSAARMRCGGSNYAATRTTAVLIVAAAGAIGTRGARTLGH